MNIYIDIRWCWWVLMVIEAACRMKMVTHTPWLCKELCLCNHLWNNFMFYAKAKLNVSRRRRRRRRRHQLRWNHHYKQGLNLLRPSIYRQSLRRTGKIYISRSIQSRDKNWSDGYEGTRDRIINDNYQPPLSSLEQTLLYKFRDLSEIVIFQSSISSLVYTWILWSSFHSKSAFNWFLSLQLRDKAAAQRGSEPR